MSMAELVAAGAPELPEGYFYRVRPSTITDGILVDIRRRRRFFGSEELEGSIVSPAMYESGTAAVVDGCRRAFTRWTNSGTARTVLAGAEKFYGDHDPKGGRR